METMELIRKKIREMIPLNNGIFSAIDYQYPAVFNITDQEMDFMFVTNCGLRTIAPVVVVAYEQNSEAYITTLAQMIKHMYTPKWDKLAAMVNLQYDPIHNYSDTVHEEITEDIEGSDTLTHNTTVANTEQVDNDTSVSDSGTERMVVSKQGSKTRTDNLSEAVANTDENNVFGFNSVQAVGSDTGASNTTRTNTGTQGTSETGSDESTKYGGLVHTTDGTIATEGTKRTTGTEGTEKSSNRERVRDLTHLGNIGNITTQQLINEEIKLWRWNFIQELLNDVKDFLTIPVYD